MPVLTVSGSAIRRHCLTLIAALSLAACASGPSENLSLVPSELGTETQREGLFTQPVKWQASPAGCRGECPTLVVDSLSFPGNPALTTLVDHALASMTWIDEDPNAPYDSLTAYRDYFLKTAASRDRTDLIARTRYRNQDLTVVELTASLYQTGMAHGITGSQFLNWDNRREKALNLDAMLEPGARPAYDAALKQAYLQWLQAHQDDMQDPHNFARMWPFVSTDNAAITDLGLVVRYQPYEIAPYAWGQPELRIPYSALHGILRPAFLPPQS